MKKIIIIISIFSFFVLTALKPMKYDEAQGIHFFEGSWADAVKKAKKEKKNLFLDISASWCGPCKMLKHYSFTNGEVGDFFNKYYISKEVDGEVGEGIALASKYRIDGYPSLFFMDANEKILMTAVGYRPADKLLDIAKGIVTK